MRGPAPGCRRCPRLAALRRTVRRTEPGYHEAPVRVFGPPDAALLVIGLAPGWHGDGLELPDCRITNAVKCLPPNNRPVAAEIRACNRFLADEIAAARVLLTLGGIAHKATVGALGLRQTGHPFGHGAEYELAGGHRLVASYHCSRYNRNTRRLTPAMLDALFARARAAVDSARDLSSGASGAS